MILQDQSILSTPPWSHHERIANMATTSWYGYHYYAAGVKKHSGITTEPKRRESEHQTRWPGGYLQVVTGPMTEAQARAWEAEQTKTITPPR
jgi:hypothetical protein